MYVLAADIGSTFTKLTAIDAEKRRILASAKAFTTIGDNVMNGYNEALKKLLEQTGNIRFDKKLAASSAAGGLKMVSAGLVPDLTAKAARLAASSAGAKVVKTYSYELTETELNEIAEISPDIILLSGGIDGGNKEVIIKNAEALTGITGSFSVIVAGNKSAAAEIASILKESGKDAVICENVMPEFNKLNIMPAKKAIRDLFIKNIISAKGLDELQANMSAEVIPTPLAVFNAIELLSRGAYETEGLGDLMAFDIGGATTDVYSMSDGAPTNVNTVCHGLAEPYAKRTVEGDIGMRYSLPSLVEAAGAAKVARTAGTSEEAVAGWVAKCKENPGAVPQKGTPESAVDDALAALAVEISAERHTGSVEKTYTIMGEVFLQTGKDLTGAAYVIGTGGQVINSQKPLEILKRAAFDISNPCLLKPLNPKYLLDAKYCLSAMGLLSALEPDTAIEIMKNELVPLL